MIFMVQWADWLQSTRVLKFADRAAAEGYEDGLPGNYTAFIFDAGTVEALEQQPDFIEMMKGRTSSRLVEMYNAFDPNQPAIKSFHDQGTARRRIGLRLISRAATGAVMEYTNSSKSLQRTPDGMLPRMGAGKTTKMAKTAKAPKEGGVIAEIIAILKNGGGTVGEIFAQLQAKFPDRGDGMKTTAAIQVRRLHTQGKLTVISEKIVGRGTVHRAV